MNQIVAARPLLNHDLHAIDATPARRLSVRFVHRYANVGKPDKAELFFKLHELQTMSWGASKIGRVAQTIDPDNNMLYSEFDTQIFSLTAIPIIGFWKLLPTYLARCMNQNFMPSTRRLLEHQFHWLICAQVRRLRRHRFQNEHK